MSEAEKLDEAPREDALPGARSPPSEPQAPSAGWTPGPWVHSRFGFQVLTGDSWSTVCTLPGRAVWEDGRGSYEQAYEWQQQEATARLIAASPDLYEALDYVLSAHGEQLTDAFDQAHKALALARGETK